MNKIIIFLTYAYPNREKFFKILDTLDKNNVYGVEIGIPSRNPYLDGEIIKNATEKVYINGFDEDEFISDIKGIYNKYNFKKYLMGYDTEIKEYRINKISEYYDGIIVVDSLNNIKQIPLVKPNEKVNIEKIKNGNPDFIYLISGEGKTGSFQKTPNQYLENLRTIKEHLDIPCFIGFGITTKSDVENIISSGADGAIIGSKFVSLVDDLGKVREYIIELKGSK